MQKIGAYVAHGFSPPDRRSHHQQALVVSDLIEFARLKCVCVSGQNNIRKTLSVGRKFRVGRTDERTATTTLNSTHTRAQAIVSKKFHSQKFLVSNKFCTQRAHKTEQARSVWLLHTRQQTERRDETDTR